MILVLDNYDSFVHNLARYIRQLGHDTHVVRCDQIHVDECRDLQPDAIVISPGPRRPEEAGISVQVIQSLGPTVPTLGICLGHQAIGTAFGAKVVTCGPVHGMETPISHDGTGLFEGCPNPMSVGRYHSLAIDRQTLPDSLHITAETDIGEIMGVRHHVYPIHGMQFHPESVLTPQGSRTLENFLTMASSHGSHA